jgi:hypothetical protein
MRPSRPPNASTSIMPRVTHFKASRRAQIPSLPAKPPVLVLCLNQVTPMVLWWTAANPADSVQPPCQPHSCLGHHVVLIQCWFCGQTNKPSCLVLWSNPAVFWLTAENSARKTQPHLAKHRARQAFNLRLLDGLLGLAPFNGLAATLHRLDLGFETQPRNRTRLRLAFLATMRPALDPVRPPGPWSRAYLSLYSSEASLSIGPNANQVTIYTRNTRPRASPHHVVNHSSHQGVTIHRSSDAPVLKWS